jgi:hypothetical protein
MWRPFLSHHDIRTVIDIGANTGQFAGLIHRLCPNARILSFEPDSNGSPLSSGCPLAAEAFQVGEDLLSVLRQQEPTPRFRTSARE